MKTPQRRRFSDREIVGAIEAEEELALGSNEDLSDERADALSWYKRDPDNLPTLEGRSTVVDGLVADQIEMMMPSFIRVFASGTEVGRFEPQGPEDEKPAEAQSEVVNWCLMRAGYYEAVNSAIRDALLLRNGYVKVWWDTRTDISQERYQGQSNEELALLMADPEVEVVEHDEYPDPLLPLEMLPPGAEPPMLHDVVVERKKPTEGIAIAAVPPDEILVSHRHRTICLRNADFVQHRRRLSIAELRDLGYEVEDDIQGDDELDTQERDERARFEEYSYTDQDNTSDPSRRLVTLRETFMRLDVDGTGKPQLWRFCVVGTTILHREQCEQIPIAAFSPLIYPHSHAGTSVYALIADQAEIKTALWRQLLDNLYLQNATRTAVDQDRVHIDDLLVSRPGGVVRIEGSPGDALMPLVTPPVVGEIGQAIEMVTATAENRTGVHRVNQGTLDPSAINRAAHTATGIGLMQSAGNARMELMARTLASGVEDMFLVAHHLLLKHSTKPIQVKLSNQWVPVDPREWAKRSNFSISVALGTGNPEAQMAKLQSIMQFMVQGKDIGMVGPNEFYNWGVEYLRAAGYRSPDKFIKEPPPNAQMPQPGPPPEVQAAQAVAQSTIQKAQIDAQSGAGKAQLDAQTELQREQIRVQGEIQREQMRQQSEDKRHLRELAAKVIIETMKLQGAQVEQASDQQHEVQLKAMESRIQQQSERMQ